MNWSLSIVQNPGYEYCRFRSPRLLTSRIRLFLVASLHSPFTFILFNLHSFSLSLSFFNLPSTICQSSIVTQ